MSTLWMGDLETYMDETFIRNAFASVGRTVLSVKLIRNRVVGGPAGYCFVDFPDPQSAEDCLKQVNGLPLPGSNPQKRFKLNWATHGARDAGNPEFSIFVGDLTPDVTDLVLRNFFCERFPSCKGAKVVIDQGGNSRGYGFVRFGDENEHTRALNEMQGASGCGGRPIRVSLATPKKTMNQMQQHQPHQQQYYDQFAQYQMQQAYMAAWQYQMQQAQYLQYPYQTNTDNSQLQAQAQNSTNDTTEPLDNTLEDDDVDKLNTNFVNQQQSLLLKSLKSRWMAADQLLNANGN
ncbi:tRNA selenocysteine 1-associated protein 1 [Trichoplax sp. H2]|nr:tRNA selenocysteine 1-associated protein 1 [Trichoplax sp. H2]|eukprot:RDD41341.1 tRNA selenocysteine 1-associated protein 1 [Trichoplax sp. H2]